MGFFKNVLKGATTLNPKKSVKHFVGSIVDPAGTTIREGRGQSSLPSNLKGYYDPGGALTPKIIGATPTKASPMQQYALPPLGQSAQKAPPLPGMGPTSLAGMTSSPKMVPGMQQAALTAATAAPGAGRSFKTSQAPTYTSPSVSPISGAQQGQPVTTSGAPLVRGPGNRPMS
jgi:hypothetical protein